MLAADWPSDSRHTLARSNLSSTWHRHASTAAVHMDCTGHPTAGLKTCSLLLVVLIVVARAISGEAFIS